MVAVQETMETSRPSVACIHVFKNKDSARKEKGKSVQFYLLPAIICHYYYFMSTDLLLNLPKLPLDEPTGTKTAWFYKKCTIVTDPCEIRVYSVSSQLSRADDSDEPIGVRRWRRELKKAVADYVIVFQGSYYGIFHVMEFSVLAGYTVRLLPKELGTPDEILERYGIERST